MELIEEMEQELSNGKGVPEDAAEPFVEHEHPEPEQVQP